MKIKTILTLTATVAFGAALIGTTESYAADTTNNMTTDGSISFFDTNKPGPGPFEGNLALAYVPTSFNFGNNDSSGVTGAATYRQKIATGKKQYVSVSDDRTSKLKGWKLKANLTDFVSTKDATNTLANATLSFKVGNNQKYNMNPALSDTNQTPTPSITDAGSLEALSAAAAAYYEGPASGAFVQLTAAGAEQEVLAYKTQTQEPAGYLGVAREISSVSLSVKDHSNVANNVYHSKINWVLSEDI